MVYADTQTMRGASGSSSGTLLVCLLVFVLFVTFAARSQTAKSRQLVDDAQALQDEQRTHLMRSEEWMERSNQQMEAQTRLLQDANRLLEEIRDALRHR